MPGQMDVKGLQRQLRRFAADRDWDQFHTPKNLAMALAGEAGELLEEFQWLTPEQSSELSADALDRVRAELADVQIHVLRLAELLGIELEPAVRDKIALNEAKYPVGLAKGSAEKSTRLGQ